ncbi:MAG: peptidyl-prolyl cis-trans isomerase [Planctomycetota bacterium]|jgi:hypothetical protein
MDLDSIKNDKAMMKVRTLWKEPLFYFFLLGTVIFGIHAFLKANSSKESDRYEVQITSSDVDWLRNRWNKLMSRDPTPDELQGLIDSMIREEILYREAVAMGLDEKDTVVRRRLAQKMEFLFKDLADMAQPSDQQLTDYFKENQDRYRIPANITFTHIFFSSDKRSQTAQADAAAAFEKIQQRNINHENALSLGDPFMKGLAFGDQSTDQVARIFGNYFSEKLEVLETGKWQGPVRSSYGWHLVYIDKLIPTSVPELEQVRSKVQIDYVSQNRDKVNRQVYEDISARYSVLVEDLPYDLEIK